MKHVIIGTAGHVDHGKTQLVKALTGTDTDRLAEEKKRGITIELGFARIDFPDGTQAGIVDVPGHERFIKNMLAGAGGVDLAMLVIAADEGFKPQTVEHLNILTLLGVKAGVIVLTKCDLVDGEWLELMQEEIHERTVGSFLEGAELVTVSAYTGQGIDRLRDCLHSLVAAAAEKSTRIPFRLPVDRVFSIDGFGTVVTGTLVEGCINEGDAAELRPSGAHSRVRSLQVHGKDVATAYAGQRVAVNLAGVRRSEVERGDILVRPGSIRSSLMLDVRLQCLSGSPRVITNGMRVHLYHGSTVTLSKIVLLETECLNPGESGYAQLRMSEPLSCKSGDRFVLRFYSPLETIGGGVILDDSPPRRKRFDSAVISALKIKESGSSQDRVLQALTELGSSLPDAAALASKLGQDAETLAAELESLALAGRISEPLPGRYASGEVMDKLALSCRELLSAYHEKAPLHGGILPAELRQKLFGRMEPQQADAFLGALVREGSIKRIAGRYALPDFEVRLTKRQAAIRESLLKAYESAGIEPPFTEEVIASFPPKEQAEAKRVLESTVSRGELVMLSPQLCYHKTAYDRALAALKAHFEQNETITLAELRDSLGTSRKYALSFLEHCDKLGITKKEGDFRRLAAK